MTPPAPRAPLPRLAQAFTAPATPNALEQLSSIAPDADQTDPADPVDQPLAVTYDATPVQAQPPHPPPRGGASTQPRRSTAADGTAAASSTSVGGTRIAAVYVPVAVRDQLRMAAVGDTSQTDVVLTAIEAATQAGHLDQAFPPARPAGALFPARTQPRRRRHEQAQVQVTLRLTPSELDTLDQLVQQTGAPNRSAYVSAALQAHFKS